MNKAWAYGTNPWGCLREVPTEHFPLSRRIYLPLLEELLQSADRARALGYHDLAAAISSASAAIDAAWEQVLEAERSGR